MSTYYRLGDDGLLYEVENVQVIEFMETDVTEIAKASKCVTPTKNSSAASQSSSQLVSAPPARSSAKGSTVKKAFQSNSTEHFQDSFVDLTKKNPRVQDIYEDPDFIYSVENRLLEEVFSHPPLFDSSLSMMERAVDVKIRHFKAIAFTLNEEFETNFQWQVIKCTWDQHRTLYVRYNNSKKAALSGSEATMPNAPKHYHILRNYDAIIEKREQASSLSKEGLSMHPVKRGSKQEAVGKYLKTATNFLESLATPGKVKPTPKPSEAESASSTFTQPNLTGANPNLIFFNGLLSDIQKLNPKDERNLKKVIIDSLYGHLDKYEEDGVVRIPDKNREAIHVPKDRTDTYDPYDTDNEDY